MKKEEIENYLISYFKDIYPLDSWGEKSYFLNPKKQLKRGTYFATIKEKDGANDKASDLNRCDVFRLNMGLSKKCYLSLFSHLPQRPAKGEIIKGQYDFKKLDIITPHPVYGWMGWVSVLNPTVSTFEECKNLLNDAYNKALLITFKKIKKLNQKD